MGIHVLIVDDDPDIRDILKLTLEEENYQILEAGDGEEALRIIRTRPLHLVLLDSKIPKVEGPEVLRTIKKDILLRHLPVIMVTGKGEVHDKIDGIDAGADDYVVKPFEPKELIARIKMVLRRTERDLDANPLSRLPGNVSIIAELTRRLDEKLIFSVCYVDLDKFKAYNDTYGFEHGDEVIRETARILIRTTQECGNTDDFIGHIGGDDYVVITTPDKVDPLCQKIIAYFDNTMPTFYNETDRTNGYILAHSRKGDQQKIPLLSISIGVVSNETRPIRHLGEIGEIGAELKALAKSQEKSVYIKDQRTA